MRNRCIAAIPLGLNEDVFVGPTEKEAPIGILYFAIQSRTWINDTTTGNGRRKRSSSGQVVYLSFEPRMRKKEGVNGFLVATL